MHLVDSLEFAIDARDHRQAVDVQNRIGSLGAANLPAMLAGVMDRHDSAGQIIRFGRLELDLGQLDPEALESQLLERLEAELDRTIAAHASETSTHKWGQAKTDAVVEMQSQASSTLAALIHFLRSGALRWHAEPSVFDDLDAVVEALIEQSAGELRSSLQPALASPRVRRRLLTNLAPATLYRLIAMLIDKPARPIEALHHILQRYRKVWSIAGLVETYPEAGLEPLLARTERFRASPDQIELLLYVWLEVRFEETSPTGADWMQASIEQIFAEARPSDQLTTTLVSFLQSRGKGSGQRQIAKPGPEAADVRAVRKSASEDRLCEDQAPAAEEAASCWQVRNAGLVLLWPYLERYLSRLGLWRDGAFTTSEAHAKAVHMLQALVSGRSRYREFDLILTKVLAGYPMDRPIDPPCELDPSVEGEIEKLLVSAIAHWPKTGALSAEGFRASFLLRDGRLSQTADGWSLHVERRGYDVLLDYLGHTISVVRLPWMAEVLMVEW